MADVRAFRLTAADAGVARQLFQLMGEVFSEPSEALSDAWLARLLGRPDFWALAAVADDELIGGLTAHELPMTRRESSELLIYAIAVRRDRQRTGVGRLLISTLRDAAAAGGVEVIFVPADNEDVHALDFYRALGGEPSAVTHFTFRARKD